VATAHKTVCWLKLEADIQYGRHYGYKVVGVTQSQPKTGAAIYLELNIEDPQPYILSVPNANIHIKTETDKIIEELSDDP